MSRERVPGDDLEYERDTLTYRAGQRFTGIAEERFPDGGLHFETEYRLGVLDGLSRTYWPGGEVRIETWWDHGVKLRERTWYADGRPQEDLVLDRDGVRHHYRWSADGTVEQAYDRGINTD